MRRRRSTTHPAASQPRVDRILQSQESDTYGLRRKLPEPTACPTCGAVYRDGRWTWGSAPSDAHQAACPACRRTADDYPAGIVSVSGDFAVQHADEIRNLARNVEQREKKEHPLKRIMAIREEEGALVFTTTNARLARGIGEAFEHAYHGDLEYTFSEAESVLRVNWKR
jgi:NMD protein affecting ribosome stability and mRNA decay